MMRREDIERMVAGGERADGLDLRGVDLRGGSFRGVRMAQCHLHGAQCEGTDWSGCIVRVCVLDGAWAAGAHFDDGRLEDCSASGADLRGASFQRAGLSETGFERAILKDAIFDGAHGDGIVFRGADLAGASFVGARFEDADFRGADLRGARFAQGVFRHADFRGALLEGVDLAVADCSAALFDADIATAPRAAGEAASLQQLQGVLNDLVSNASQGTAPRSALLRELLTRAGMSQQAPGVSMHADTATRLNNMLDELRGLQARTDAAPQAAVEQCHAMLREVLPGLDGVLKEADWRALSDILASAQTQADKPGDGQG